MLQVGVHHDDCAAACGREPGHERGLMSEIAREPEAPHAHVVGAQALDRVPRAVGAPIVDDDELPVAAVGGRIHDRADVAVEDVEVVLLVVRGYQQQQAGFSHGL